MMSFCKGLRRDVGFILLAGALFGCQGDDNTLPLPPDASAAADAHTDASAPHDGAAPDAATDATVADALAEAATADVGVPDAPATADVGVPDAPAEATTADVGVPDAPAEAAVTAPDADSTSDAAADSDAGD